MSHDAQILMTIKDTAKALQIAPKTLYRLASKGEIPSRKIGGSVRIPAEWLKEQAKVNA